MTPTAIVIAIAGGVIAAISAITVALIAARTNSRTTAVAWAGQLVERLENVERKVTDLEAQLTASQKALHAAVRFIDRLVTWGAGGGIAASRPKPPRSLHEYLDADVWATPDLDAPTDGGGGAA